MSNIPNLSPLRLAYLNKRVRSAEGIIPDSLDALKRAYARGMALVWSQEGGIGPAEVLESLGTDAAALFVEGNKLITFILEADPDWQYPAPTHEFTINEDGSVTLGAPIEEEQVEEVL